MASKSTELYLRLLSYVVPYKRTFALGILAMVLLAATEPLGPALMQPLLDGSFVEKDPTTIRWMPVLVIVLFVIRGLLSFGSKMAITWVANKVVMDLRNLMFRRLVSLPTAFYDNSASGELLSKLTYDVTQVAEASTKVLTVLVKDSLSAIGLVAFMLYIDWKLSLVVVVIAPVIGFIIIAVSGRLRRMSVKVQTSMGDITRVAQEGIESHKVVKVYGGQAYETERFEQASKKARQYTMKVVAVSAANVPIVQTLLSVALAVVIYFALMQSSEDALTVGGFVSFFTAMSLLLSPVKRLAGVNTQLQRGLAAAGSVFDLVEQVPESDSGSIQIAGRSRGVITYENVTLDYQQGHAPALDNVSIHIREGETVALVGASGSGKSSFVNLLPRFYHPASGVIKLDDTNIEELTLESLRSSIALVSQEVILFNDSIYNNIAYGTMRDVDSKAVVEAAEAAHVMEFVQQMPEGLQTMIGESGVRLSGGQRQRLAIARALLKNSPVLLLDEATSSLDTASERHIQEALDFLRKGRTCLIIAHRLSTIENADRIVVLSKGRIVEEGTHAELMSVAGEYAKLHQVQLSGQKDG